MAMNPNAHPNMHMGMNVPRPTGPNDVGAQQLSAATARAIPTSAAAPSPVAPAPPDFRAFLADLVTQPYNSWFADQVFAAYTQDLERDAKRRSSPPQQPGQQQQVPVQPQQMQPQPQPQQQAQQAQQQQGQSQGQRRGGRPPRGRNQ
jgi:hypothetical protein